MSERGAREAPGLCVAQAGGVCAPVLGPRPSPSAMPPLPSQSRPGNPSLPVAMCRSGHARQRRGGHWAPLSNTPLPFSAGRFLGVGSRPSVPAEGPGLQSWPLAVLPSRPLSRLPFSLLFLSFAPSSVLSSCLSVCPAAFVCQGLRHLPVSLSSLSITCPPPCPSVCIDCVFSLLPCLLSFFLPIW